MRPTCVECEVEFKVAKVGVIIETMTIDSPYELRASDLLECPSCGIKILAPGALPLAHSHNSDYVEKREAFNPMYRSWATLKEKKEYQFNEITGEISG